MFTKGKDLHNLLKQTIMLRQVYYTCYTFFLFLVKKIMYFFPVVNLLSSTHKVTVPTNF